MSKVIFGKLIINNLSNLWKMESLIFILGKNNFDSCTVFAFMVRYEQMQLNRLMAY